MMNINNGTFDLCTTLRQRLRQINADRERSQIKINEASEQLQNLVARVPKKSRETNEQLDAKIQELEKKRTQSSISLSVEKDILRQMAAVKKLKTLNDEAAVAEKGIKDKKADIAAEKDNLRNFTAQIAELEKSLSRMELAERLGCSSQDLISHKVDCPEEKLGRIIGKNGMNIKQLEDKSGCIIDVDKVMHQIHIQGNDVAIMAVVNEIETIIRSTMEEIDIDLAMYYYLTCKRMAGLNRFQQLNPGVFFDLVKESKVLQIRGLPEYLDSVKHSIMALDVQMITLPLNGREASLIIGKGGAQINQLIEEFDVSIDVEKKDDLDEARIVGTGNNPKKALAKIQEVIFQTEDVERSILIRSIVKNKLLSNSGALIKRLQKDAVDACGTNVMVYIDKEDKDDKKSSLTTLIVKSPRSFIELASTHVEHAIQKYESAVLSVPLDSEIISCLLEKGGSIINDLRDRFSGDAEISVSKESNEILVLSDNHSVKDSIKKELEKFAGQNQVYLFKTDASLFGLIFGSKSLRDALQSLGVVVQKDVSTNTIRVRGSSDGITSATFLLNDFLSRNYSEDFNYPEEDEQYLYTRNIFNKLQDAHDVKINGQKGVATIRGEKSNVMVSVNELSKILFGDAEYAVAKVIVPQLAIGVIIGKGGSGISQLEQKHKAVTISIYRASNCLCLRGPKKAVDECRGSLAIKIAAVSVAQPIEISPVEYETLKNAAEIIRSIQDETSVQVSLSESILKIKGTAVNVSEAQGLFEELLRGIYRATVSFDSAMIKQIEVCINQDLIDLIVNETKCSMVFDTKLYNMAISGKRSNVRKAKTLLMDVLIGSLPDNFARIKIPSPLVKAMNNASSLASISAKSGSFINFDIDTHSIILQSSSAHKNNIAVDLVQSLLVDSQRLIFVIPLEQDDSWILTVINWVELAENIKSATKCVLQPFHDDLLISITGQTEDYVQNARKMLENAIDHIKGKNIVMDIPEEAMTAFLGRKNSNLNALARDHGVSIERLKKGSNRIRLHGDNLLSAIIAIKDWVQDWETKNVKKHSLPMPVELNDDSKRAGNSLENSNIPLEILTSPDAFHPTSFQNVANLGPVPSIYYASNHGSSLPQISSSLEDILVSVTAHGGKGFSDPNTGADTERSSYIPITTRKTLSTDENSSKTSEVGIEPLPRASGAQSLFNLLSSGGGMRAETRQVEGCQKTINGATYYTSASGITIRI